MLVKKIKDQVVHISPTSSEIHQILSKDDRVGVAVAVSFNIPPSKAHYHKGFEEIYFVLDGSITLKLYDPQTEKIWTQNLAANELAAITAGIHHQILESSPSNRLTVLSYPPFDPTDEHFSDKI
jgi:mannose-6-phosphate isomerase-like protein (cupin superfamily)